LISTQSFASCDGSGPGDDQQDTTGINYEVILIPTAILGGIAWWYFSKKKHNKSNYQKTNIGAGAIRLDPYLYIESEQLNLIGAKITVRF